MSAATERKKSVRLHNWSNLGRNRKGADTAKGDSGFGILHLY
jgi:hypothetical protein